MSVTNCAAWVAKPVRWFFFIGMTMFPRPVVGRVWRRLLRARPRKAKKSVLPKWRSDFSAHFAMSVIDVLRLQHHDVRRGDRRPAICTSRPKNSTKSVACLLRSSGKPSRSETASARSSRTGRRRLRRARSTTNSSCSSPSSPPSRYARAEGLGEEHDVSVDSVKALWSSDLQRRRRRRPDLLLRLPAERHLRQLRRVLRPRRADGARLARENFMRRTSALCASSAEDAARDRPTSRRTRP